MGASSHTLSHSYPRLGLRPLEYHSILCLDSVLDIQA